MNPDMMAKLQEMQQKTEEVKKRLDTITLEEKSPDGNVTVVMTGNREVKDISIAQELQQGDPEELQDMLVLAMNKAIASATKVNEAEMSSVAMGMLPNMGM